MSLQRRSGASELRVEGEVGHALGLAVADLEETAGEAVDISAQAPGFAGRAVPVAPLLAVAGPLPGADHCTVSSGDGHYTASIPLADLNRSGWLVFALGDGPLPRDRGGPLRLLVPQGTTLCWNVKDVVAIRLTRGPEPDSVPANPPH